MTQLTMNAVPVFTQYGALPPDMVVLAAVLIDRTRPRSITPAITVVYTMLVEVAPRGLPRAPWLVEDTDLAGLRCTTATSPLSLRV